jgi:hypothetical protein
MVSLAKRIRARDLCTNTLLSVVEYYDNHPFFREPVDFDEHTLDRMASLSCFKTEPRVGNAKDTLEFVIGRNVYYALTVMEEYQPHLSVFPEYFVKAGSPLFYKGFAVTTDAVLKPGSWMLPPNSIFCVSTRRNGSTLITRPCAIEVEIPALDEADVFPVYQPCSNKHLPTEE